MIDFDNLLKLRLVVARYGEMDLAKWWNTRGQLGSLGALTLRRGFPRTHQFAQARSVFAVAAQRCADVFNHPDSSTLWRLPDSIEEEFDARWERWIENSSEWRPFFERLHQLSVNDLAGSMLELQVINSDHVAAFAKLRRSAEGRAVPLPGTFTADQDCLALLALGFARGEVGAPCVPYARRADH